MSFDECAQIVRDHDPDRFLSVMAAPQKTRGTLFAIYAFNSEVARAAWISQEPMVCEIRLQWWADQLDAIIGGGDGANHQVLAPLAQVVDPGTAKILGEVINARRWDCQKEPFADGAALQRHLMGIGGALNWAAARAIGAKNCERQIREMGQVAALAGWLQAVPDLQAMGRVPLPDPSAHAIGVLAGDGLLRFKRARKQIPPIARPATRAGWRTNKTLRLACANPAAVAGGRLHSSEFSRRASLLLRALVRSA